MSGHPPMHAPGPHPQMHGMPGQQHHHPQGLHMPGNPMQGQQQMAMLQAMAPFYLGFNLVPMTLPDGKQSWVGITPQQIHKSQLEFAEIIKKDKNNKIKVGEVYQNSSLIGEKRRQIDRILHDHRRTERDPNLEWQLASIKLTETDLVSGFAKLLINKTQVNKIRVILKRSVKVPKATRRQSDSLPFNVNVHHQAPMGGFPHHDFQQRQPQMFGEMPPVPPQHHGGHGPQGGQWGRPAMVPLGRARAAEVVSDNEFDRDSDDHHQFRIGGKKGKKDRSTSPRIRIPELRDRRDSKTSSRNTTYSYDSEALSPGESPNTSRSNSPRHWPDSKRYSSNSKKYHSRKGSDYSRRDRRGSMGSNDSFVMVPNHSSRRYSTGGSNRGRAIERWSRGISPSNRHRDSRHDESDQRALERALREMRVTELERQEEDRLDLEHKLEINDRLHRLERKSVVHQDLGRYGRPSLNRARSDRGSIGFLSRPRFGGSAMLWD